MLCVALIVSQFLKEFMDDNKQAQHQMIVMLGQIQGELRGVREIVQANHSSLHQRIDDMVKSNEARFENVEDRISKVESNHQQLLMKTAAGGGMAGGIVAAGIEIIKAMGGS